MIISASRRTDIPSFYSEWFMGRIREGFFCRVNPFNRRQSSIVNLKPSDVDAICFWTKNPKPLMKHLKELDCRGFNYFFQFTLNPYEKVFEPNLPPIQARVEMFRELASIIGTAKVLWRYDPVVLTTLTPVEWHLEKAERIAAEIGLSTNSMFFSFYDFYGKGEGRFARALKKDSIIVKDITLPEHSADLKSLVEGFSRIASTHNLNIFTCCEPFDLTQAGVGHGACIDGALINALFGTSRIYKRDKNQRKHCGCAESIDIGSYNSCHFMCKYCYANSSDKTYEYNRNNFCVDSPALTKK